MNFQEMDSLGGLIAGNRARMEEDSTLLNQQKTLADLAKMQQDQAFNDQMNPLKLDQLRAQTAQTQAQTGQIGQQTEESRQRVSRENAKQYIQDMIQYGDTPGAEDYLADKYGVKGHPVTVAFQQAKKRGEEAAMMSDQVDPLQYVRMLQEKIAMSDDKSRQTTATNKAMMDRTEATNAARTEQERIRQEGANYRAEMLQSVASAKIAAQQAAATGKLPSAQQVLGAALMKVDQAERMPEGPEKVLAMRDARRNLDQITFSLGNIASARTWADAQAEAERLKSLVPGLNIDPANFAPRPAPAANGAPDPQLQAALQKLGQPYEPDKFDYRVTPDGQIQRKAKAATPNPNSGNRPQPVLEQPMSDAMYYSQEPQISSRLQRPKTAPVVDSILKTEGTGANPRSSAVGPGQFINDTMVAKFREWYPDRARGMSDQQILALRVTDPQLMRDMTARYADENTNGLEKAGIPPTKGNIYLAHHFGLSGAKRLLNAGRAYPVSDILSPEVLRANPHLKRMSIGDLIDWAHKQVGS